MTKSDAQTSPRELKVSEIPGPDFTTYRERTDLDEALPPGSLEPRARQKTYSYPGSLTINHSESGSIECRSLACSAYKGKFWSITLRSDRENIRTLRKTKYYVAVERAFTNYLRKNSGHRDAKDTQAEDEIKVKDFLGYWPRGYSDYAKVIKPAPAPSSGSDKPPPEEIFLNDIYTLCSELDQILFTPTEKLTRPSGLIVITGATDSSKSLITRGLIFLFLQQVAQDARKRKLRRPHLVTFEDPVEQYYLRDPITKAVPQSRQEMESLLDALYIDFTPREKDTDAENLNKVLKDALRQTPAILFVGETREEEDWKDLLQFAGSGHLVITTSHAGSVIEAMSGIFRDTKTQTPAQRSEIARRIRGIINIRSFTPPDTSIRALLPALWKSTSHSMNNLIADGLASIVPARGAEKEMGYYGRTYFAARLTANPAAGTPRMTKDVLNYSRGEKAREKALDEIEKKAIEWDLKGE